MKLKPTLEVRYSMWKAPAFRIKHKGEKHTFNKLDDVRKFASENGYNSRLRITHL